MNSVALYPNDAKVLVHTYHVISLILVYRKWTSEITIHAMKSVRLRQKRQKLSRPNALAEFGF